jgi:hypothetical protein
VTDKPKIIDNFIKFIIEITPAKIAGNNDPGDVACAEKQLRAVVTMLRNQKEQAIVRADLISQKPVRKPPLRRPFRGR